MQDTSILVASCDKYGDLWRPFFELFWRHWPDCPYPVHLGTSRLDFDDPRVRVIRCGADTTWCGHLHRFLDRIESRRVILFLDDFLLTATVDTALVTRLVDLALTQELACLRLFPAPPPSCPVASHAGVGVILPGEPYRASTQVAVWDVDYLRTIAHPSLDIWQFEHFGTLVSDRIPGRVWGTWRPAIEYRHGVERGRWRPEGLGICRTAGIEPDLSRRGLYDATLDRRPGPLRHLTTFLMEHLPAPLRRGLRRYRPRKGVSRLLPPRS